MLVECIIHKIIDIFPEYTVQIVNEVKSCDFYEVGYSICRQ